MRVLLTGVAGFIGFHLARGLLARGCEVVALDNLNSYYDPQLKQDRLTQLGEPKGFRFAHADIADRGALADAVGGFSADTIIHLAAQAGVRHSIENPSAYADSNLTGHLNMLELARRTPGLKQMLYASSSSVYGDRHDVPFRETDRCDAPVSLYAATKRSGELMAESYARLYGLSLIGLRFFTVYGPWGRPDMAYWLFADAILRGAPLRLFNNGDMRRDFTDVRDVVEAMVRMVESPAKPGHEIYNIGHADPVSLRAFVEAIEAAAGKSAQIDLGPMQPGDVQETFADVSKLHRDFGFTPRIDIKDGMAEFVAWFRDYRHV